MNKHLIHSLLIPGILILMVIFSCIKEQDENYIHITAELPETVSLSDSFSNIDTLKFHIESKAKLALIRVFEDSVQIVNMEDKDFHFDKEHDFYFIYNPSSTGLKEFELHVTNAFILTVIYPFSILVVE